MQILTFAKNQIAGLILQYDNCLYSAMICLNEKIVGFKNPTCVFSGSLKQNTPRQF